MLLFSSYWPPDNNSDHVTVIVVDKTPSAQGNVHWAETTFKWARSILNDILALGIDLDM